MSLGTTCKLLTKDEREQLTVKQEVFVNEYLSNGFKGKLAAQKAYNTDNPHVMSTKTLKHPKIQEIIMMKKEELRNRFVVEAENAFNALLELINDDKCPKHVKLAAIKDLLDRAGLGGVQQTQTSIHLTVDTPQTRELIRRARFTEDNTIDVSPEHPQE